MENTAIMNNEVMETTEEIIETSMSKGLKVAAGIGLTVIVGVIAYKYVAKPVIAKIKAEINQKKMVAAEAEMYVDESDVSEEN